MLDDDVPQVVRLFEDVAEQRGPIEESLKEHFEHAVEHLKSHVKVDGFREGKAPAKMVEEKLKPEALWEIEGGFALSAYDVATLSEIRTGWSRAVADLLCRHDYWIVPTAQVFPFPVEQDWPKTVGGQMMQTYHEWMQAVCLVTMSGCPALAVPAGFSPAGLPMGVQIVAPVHGEAACLAAAAAYESAAADVLKTPLPKPL